MRKLLKFKKMPSDEEGPHDQDFDSLEREEEEESKEALGVNVIQNYSDLISDFIKNSIPNQMAKFVSLNSQNGDSQKHQKKSSAKCKPFPSESTPE